MQLNLNFDEFYRNLRFEEIRIMRWIQKRFSDAEPFWFTVSEYLNTSQLLDVFVPFFGAFNQQLMVLLVGSMGVINIVNSLLKWILTAARPHWWVQEDTNIFNSTTLKQHHLTCETTSGIPCSHSMSFTIFVYIVVIFGFMYFRTAFNLKRFPWVLGAYLIILASISVMWVSRMYLATEFPHQCIIGSLIAVKLMHIFDDLLLYLFTRTRKCALIVVTCLGLIPVSVYFIKLRLGIDPHWSVREAFKWCEDPTYLRHESSPIFMLARDFGYLMGVALSAPLYKRSDNFGTMGKRFPIVVGLQMVNFLARQETPKQYGRFVFLTYEFIRNLFHSFALLCFVSKLR